MCPLYIVSLVVAGRNTANHVYKDQHQQKFMQLCWQTWTWDPKRLDLCWFEQQYGCLRLFNDALHANFKYKCLILCDALSSTQCQHIIIRIHQQMMIFHIFQPLTNHLPTLNQSDRSFSTSKLSKWAPFPGEPLPRCTTSPQCVHIAWVECHIPLPAASDIGSHTLCYSLWRGWCNVCCCWLLLLITISHHYQLLILTLTNVLVCWWLMVGKA